MKRIETKVYSENAQNVLKLDIRNNPIQEEDGEAQTVMANVANTLRAVR